MRKLHPVAMLGAGTVVVAIGGALAVRALAPSEVTVTLRDVPVVDVIGGHPDVLGLDATIAAPRGDVLDDLFVRQEGSAKWLTDLVDAKLWADAGAAGFQGIGVDRILAASAWNASENGWAFNNVHEPIAAAGTRFFVTVTTHRNPTTGSTIQLSIPAYRDDGTAMTYDTGDRGVFLRTARPTPAAAVVAAQRLTIAARATDDRAPIVRITAPEAGASLAQDWLLVRGVAQDIGGSATARVRVGINRPGKTPTWVDATPEVTGFTTWEARFFELPRPHAYELRVQGEDWIGNRSVVSEPITVELQ